MHAGFEGFDPRRKKRYDGRDGNVRRLDGRWSWINMFDNSPDFVYWRMNIHLVKGASVHLWRKGKWLNMEYYDIILRLIYTRSELHVCSELKLFTELWRLIYLLSRLRISYSTIRTVISFAIPQTGVNLDKLRGLRVRSCLCKTNFGKQVHRWGSAT